MKTRFIYRVLIKPFLDRVCAFSLLLVFLIPIILLVIISTIDTNSFGIYSQQRVGINGKLFYIYKIRTMYEGSPNDTTITTINNYRITKLGLFIRQLKLDELPQLINIVLGQMSFVGPRPDVQSSYDFNDPKVMRTLQVKPGITCFSSLIFRKEEFLLSLVNSPESFNKNYIWPIKIHYNLYYCKKYSFLIDLMIIIKTIIPNLAISILSRKYFISFTSLDSIINFKPLR